MPDPVRCVWRAAPAVLCHAQPLRGMAAAVACLAAIASCSPDDRTVRLTVHSIEPASAWTARDSSHLIHPVDLVVDATGVIYVGDDGDKVVKVQDEEGRWMRLFGGEGRGPGELESIGTLLVMDEVLAVLDGRTGRVKRWTLEGEPLADHRYGGRLDVVGAVGPSLVIANDPSWNLPPSRQATLVHVLDDGGGTRRLGRRRPAATPYAQHIMNFVIPAGSPRGRWLWLGYLNEPLLERYDLHEASRTVFDRFIPHAWRRIPTDYDPRKVPPTSARDLPFDVITEDVAVDGYGRAYVLTGGQSRSRPTFIDIVSLTSLVARRLEAPPGARRIAVSIDGAKLYVLTSLDRAVFEAEISHPDG